MADKRPDPDALLRTLQAEESRRRRGRLKVFFGAAAGVGKTYSMLEAAQREKADGVDVVIGWVETHGRAETAALTEGVERIPPRDVEYRGTRLAEFDLDAALRRRPALVLLDELAHTNVPGSRHAKRWQDVRELLEAGIHIFSTLNVQHLESVHDLVSRITGVSVQETVPDHVLDEADDVELVDLPPEELLQRMAEGKVYVPEQAARAVQLFFRKGNLIALRELALRRVAERVDAEMRAYRRAHAIDATWPVTERILVCVRPHPESDRLVRAARRMAARLGAEWIVAAVESPSQPPLRPKEKEALADTMKLAAELGAETAVLSGEDVSETLVAFARERNVSKIVVGKPAHARWRDRLKGSLLDDLVRASGGIDVYAISGDEAQQRVPGPLRASRRSPARHYLAAGAAIVLCTGVCAVMARAFDKSNLVMVYLLSVVAVATRYGRGPSALAACLSVALFDFFFVPPHLTFAVSDTQYVVTFAVMLVVGILISTLASRVRDQAEAARAREQRTRILYDLSRGLTGPASPVEIAHTSSRHAGLAARGSAVLLLPEPDGRLVPHPDEPWAREAHEVAVAQWVLSNGRAAGLSTDTLPGAAALHLPLKGGEQVLGVLAVRPDPELLPLAPGQLEQLAAFARLAAAALERARLASLAETARVAAETERLRSTLLSSVSHDLRTPLAAITGAASSLLSEAALPQRAERELKETILEESERLNRLVGNLLDMTRLESGTLRLAREWQSLEEVVGSALARLDRALSGRRVSVSVPPELPLVPMDPILVEQVFVNLVENALKYTPAETCIEISARGDGGNVLVEVADRGPGLPAGAEERVFEKFYRSGGADRTGFGLGLPICRAIVSAHGGRIWAESRQPQGAVFRFMLPLGEPPPSAPAAESAA